MHGPARRRGAHSFDCAAMQGGEGWNLRYIGTAFQIASAVRQGWCRFERKAREANPAQQGHACFEQE